MRISYIATYLSDHTHNFLPLSIVLERTTDGGKGALFFLRCILVTLEKPLHNKQQSYDSELLEAHIAQTNTLDIYRKYGLIMSTNELAIFWQVMVG